MNKTKLVEIESNIYNLSIIKKSNQEQIFYYNNDISNDKINLMGDKIILKLKTIKTDFNKFFQLSIGNWFTLNIDSYYIIVLIKFCYPEKIANNLLLNIKKILLTTEINNKLFNEKIFNKIFKYNNWHDFTNFEDTLSIIISKDTKKEKCKLEYDIINRKIKEKQTMFSFLLSNKNKIIICIIVSLFIIFGLWFPNRIRFN